MEKHTTNVEITSKEIMLLEEIRRLKMLIELRDNKITQLEKEINDSENNKRLKMLINIKDNKIKELQDEYKEQINYDKARKQLDLEVQVFETRRINAYYYETLLDILKDNEFLQGEWQRLMVYIKMACDPEEVRRLGG